MNAFKPLALCSLFALSSNMPAMAQGRFVQVADEPVQVSKYWIGLHCVPISPALRAQLNLAEDEGLLIEDAVPEHPAAKAGIMKHDILLKAGDKSVSSIRDVIAAVDAAKDNEMELTILRGGKKETLKVTPVQRAQIVVPSPHFETDLNTVRKYFENLRGGRDPRGFGVRVLRPPVAVHVEATPNLPKNLKISIHKEGDKPAKIDVERDGKKWQVTEKEIDQLPADLRPHVRSMLRGPHAANWWGFNAGDFDIRLSQPPVRVQRENQEIRVRRLPAGQSNIEKRLENAVQQIEELQKSLKELQKSLPKNDDKSKEGDEA